MPLKLQILSTNGVKWIGFGKNRLALLTRMRLKALEQGKKRIFSKTYALPDKVRIQVVASHICNIIRIRGGGVAGFICHPRSDTYPGGISSQNGSAISAVYAYPLIDDDHGSIILSPTDWELSTDVENYGNLDWLDSEGIATSWRGGANRSFVMDSLIDYPGFTIFDYETISNLPVSHFTPYQNLVYRDGEVDLTYPDGCKVLGATDIYTILGVDYAGRTNPDGGIGGFYTEVWQGIDERIGYMADSRPTVPWFFNSSGTEAVSEDKKVVVDGVGKTAAFSSLPAGSGIEAKNIVTGTTWGLDKNGNFLAYHDYVGGVLANINLLVTSSDSSLLTGSGAETFADFPIYYSGVQATSLTITGPDAYGGPGAYTATLYPVGSRDCGGDVVWTYPSVSCGMGTVSATKNGVSGSMQVRMATGQWGTITDIYNDAAAGSANHITEIISGGIRTTYVEGSVSNLHTWWTDAYHPFQGDCNNCVWLVEHIYNAELGTGLDYTYWPPNTVYGSAADCCAAAGVGAGGVTYYQRTLRIYTQPWVC